MSTKTMPLAELQAALKNQGVLPEHYAFKCPICGTVQSAADLIRAGAGGNYDEVEGKVGFSCVGRFTNAGPHKRGEVAGRGCDWTLGGLFRLHVLEVVTEDGERHPLFEPASPEEAQANMQKHLGESRS